MFVIEDEAHDERIGEFPSQTAALSELRRLAGIAWDEEPNRAPCTSWQTCGRRYELVEFDTSTTPWRELQRRVALSVSAKASDWLLD